MVMEEGRAPRAGPHLHTQVALVSICQCRGHKQYGFDPWVGKIPWRRNSTPLQYSCLENPMDRGAWWATVHGLQRVGHD